MHRDVADVVFLEKYCFLFCCEFESGHSFDGPLILLLIRFHRLRAQVHLEVGLGVVEDFNVEGDGALCSKEVKFE